MSENNGIKIFFFKSQPTDLVAVENYLTKRGYEVMSEYDLKKALVKVIQFDPSFVFLAWDHADERIHTIPRFIHQSIKAAAIPYIQSASKEHHRRLESSGFIHKIYPPVSGPGIIRTILTIEKELAQKQITQELKEIQLAKTKEASFTFIPGEATKNKNLQNFLDEMESPANPHHLYTPSSTSEKKSNIIFQKGIRGELLKNNQGKLKNLNLKKIDSHLKDTLKEDFKNTIKNKIIDIIQTYHEEEGTSVSTENKAYQKLFCLIVQSESWCGYLLASTQLKMNHQDYHSILQSWLQNQFVNMNEITDNDYFEINLENTENIELKEWAKEKADYLEIIEIDEKEVLVSFFSIDPKNLIIEINDSYEMLEVPLTLISTEKKVLLSLFLHLPDNKKYILYTPANQILSSQQKNKLSDKFIDKLYTPLDFEKELNKLKAEAYLNDSVKQIKKVATS